MSVEIKHPCECGCGMLTHNKRFFSKYCQGSEKRKGENVLENILRGDTVRHHYFEIRIKDFETLLMFDKVIPKNMKNRVTAMDCFGEGLGITLHIFSVRMLKQDGLIKALKKIKDAFDLSFEGKFDRKMFMKELIL